MRCIMGIDIGSTNIKAVVFDENGRILSKGIRPTPYRNDAGHPAWVFYDPDEIWRCTADAIKEALGGQSFVIEGVAVTGIGMDAVPISADGEVLYPFISWRCRRTEKQYARLMAEYGKYELFRISGKQPLAYDTVHRIRWIKDNHAELYEKAYKWLLIEDFINWKLCGAFATDYSMANCTSLQDTAKREWSDRLIRAAQLDRAKLPDIRQAGSVLGTVTAKAAGDTALREGTSVVLGGHDYHCAAFACNALEGGKLIDSTGTFDCITTACDAAVTTRELFEAGMSCECHVARGKYSLQCSMPSGGILEWWKQNFAYRELIEARQSDGSVWDAMMQSVSEAKRDIYFLPHLFGCESPVFDPFSRGAFLGMNQNTTREDMLLALLDGLSFQMRLIVESMEKAVGGRFNEIIAVGGATRNAFWMQSKANIIGKRIVVPSDMDEATCLGAALLAGIGAGVYPGEQEAIERTFRPGRAYEPDRAQYDRHTRRYETFKTIYPALKQLHEQVAHEQF